MTTHNLSSSVLVGLLLLLGGCRSDSSTPEVYSEAEALADISGQSRAFSAAYVRGDVDAMMEIYTSDAVIFPSNSVAISGDSLLRKYWTLPEGRIITHHQMTPTEIQIEGAMASDHGVYQVSGSNGGSEWGPSHGKYLVVWRLESDGEWRMSLDMWNSLPNP